MNDEGPGRQSWWMWFLLGLATFLLLFWILPEEMRPVLRLLLNIARLFDLLS